MAENSTSQRVAALEVTVNNNKQGLEKLTHALLGNEKPGMKGELANLARDVIDIKSKVATLDCKMDAVLTEQRLISEERALRHRQEQEQANKDAEEAKKAAQAAEDKRWSLRWILGLLFDKFAVPVLTAVVLYILLGGK